MLIKLPVLAFVAAAAIASCITCDFCDDQTPPSSQVTAAAGAVPLAIPKS